MTWFNALVEMDLVKGFPGQRLAPVWESSLSVDSR